MADILAGVAIAIAFTHPSSADVLSLLQTYQLQIVLLLISTIGLYGGGVVFNDLFDAELDAVERPERPIPSGRASRLGASLLGSCLFLIGILAAFFVSKLSGCIAVGVAGLALLYDAYAKQHDWIGPLVMGACRGGNLLLGISLVPAAVETMTYMVIIPIVFIAAVTMVSRGEVHGGNRPSLIAAFALYLIVILGIIALVSIPYFRLSYSFIFILGFGGLIFPPLIRAIQRPEGKLIMKAVKAGVLSLILMDAAIAAGFLGWAYGIGMVVLLPLSLFIARLFRVT